MQPRATRRRSFHAPITSAAFVCVCFTAAAHAAPIITTEYGIEFATIGDPGNIPYAGGGPKGSTLNVGSGSVGYEYRMATREVTTRDWVEFVNTFEPISDGTPLETISRSKTWGANLASFPAVDTYRVNHPDMPVYGITWREAAMYVNWLHNDKAPTIEAAMSGAYDVSTFGEDENGFITDQLTRSAGARFFIPTYDEQMKAFYYDPDKGGQGPGWWQFPNSSDEPPIPGLPEEGGTTSAGMGIHRVAEFIPPMGFNLIPWNAGDFPDQLSPWGLLDTSGGVTEWSEHVGFEFPDTPSFRYGRGVASTEQFPPNSAFHIFASLGGAEGEGVREFPNSARNSVFGLRIAAIIPTPGVVTVSLACLPTLLLRRRKEI